jgi:N-glycosylase/DNA lyase
MAASLNWSAWQTLKAFPRVSAHTLAETLDGGQAFRWHRQPEGHWRGVWADCLAEIQLSGDGSLQWRAPEPLARRVAVALPRYLGLDAVFSALTDALPWRSDAHLASCIEKFPNLRLLHQPFGETLLCFLCSATKQIVQIKQMTELLARNHGAPLLRSTVRGTPSPSPEPARSPAPPAAYRLPTWEELALVPEKALRDCLLGFRARYIHETALFLAAHPGWLDETERLPYAAAKERLCSLPGVGEKVADCVLLFGAAKLEAFPVDVWIIKTLETRYGLTGWHARAIAHFGRVHFGPSAGLAQQFLFAYERAAKRGPLTNAS